MTTTARPSATVPEHRVNPLVEKYIGRPLVELEDKWLFQRKHANAVADTQIGSANHFEGFSNAQEAIELAQRAARAVQQPGVDYGWGAVIVEAGGAYFPLSTDISMTHVGPDGDRVRYNNGFRRYDAAVVAAVDGWGMLVKDKGFAG